MANPIAAWHEEHAYFGRLLKLLRKELDALHGRGQPNYELILDIVTYLREYGDDFHHPREDEAFERLARRRPEMQLVLARLQQEHRVIANAGEALLDHIGGILKDGIVPRGLVETALATYLVYYGNHIAKEEEDVLPCAAKELSPADWAAVKGAAPAGKDPLFGEPEARFRALRQQIALES